VLQLQQSAVEVKHVMLQSFFVALLPFTDG
jgi:hypothetical protein